MSTSPQERARRGARSESPPPRPLDAREIERIALAYVDRFDASARHLVRVLERRVALRARKDSIDVDAARAAIAELVQRWQGSGILDDRRYALAYARGQRARGASARKIEQALRAKGVQSELARAALAELAVEADAATDLDAARRLVQKRRLGPHRPAAPDAETERALWRKDLARLARAGFSFETARAALGRRGDDGDEF